MNLVLTVAGVAAPVAALAALGFAWARIGFDTPLDLVAQLAIPLMLITLGAAMARLSAGRTAVGLAVAVAVTSGMLAAKYGAKAEALAGPVIASTALSVATLPLALAFLI